MTPIERKYSELGAQLHGRAPIRTTPLPAPSIPAPAVPTEALTVQGVEIHPAERLTALAAIRDNHRARARMATDKTHQIREQISERDQRVKLIARNAAPGFEVEAEAQIAVLDAEISQLRAAMATAGDEATTASEAAGAAQSVLRSALRFAIDAGATVPLLLASEVK